MAITLNNINFTRTSTLGTGADIELVRKSGMVESLMNDMASNISDSAELASAIGAVQGLEIDWNGAQIELNGTLYTINTTGELISLILEAAKHKSINSSVSNQTITIGDNTVPTTLTVDQYGHLINVQ